MIGEYLVRRCSEAVSFHATRGLPVDEALIVVVTPKGWKAPPKFPRGQILQAKEDGSRVRTLPAFKLLAWLVANGFAKLRTTGERDSQS